MGTVAQLSQLGFDANQAKHLGINGISMADNGWIPATIVTVNNEVIDISNQGTYLSPTSIAFNYNVSTVVQKGDKVRWDQPTGGRKYGNVRAIFDSGTGVYAVVIVINDDYVVANEAVTNVMFSRLSLPMDFPKRFNYTPFLLGFTAGQDPTNVSYQYYISDLTCYVTVRQATPGNSNSTSYIIVSPVISATVPQGIWGIVCWQAFDNGVELSPPARAFIGSNTSNITVQSSTASGAWTAANGKAVSFTNLAYPI